MKRVLFTISIMVLGTVAYASTNHPMDLMFKSWIGADAKEAVKIWGNPTDIDYDQSQTKYKWKEERSMFIPGTQFQKKVECERILIVDTTGKIVYGKFLGNGCPFTTESVKKWNYPQAE